MKSLQESIQSLNEASNAKWFIHSSNGSKTAEFPVKEIDEELLVINLDMRSIEFTSIDGVKKEASRWGADADTASLEKLRTGESFQDGDMVFVRL